jgi:hypothetical protein
MLASIRQEEVFEKVIKGDKIGDNGDSNRYFAARTGVIRRRTAENDRERRSSDKNGSAKPGKMPNNGSEDSCLPVSPGPRTVTTHFDPGTLTQFTLADQVVVASSRLATRAARGRVL